MSEDPVDRIELVPKGGWDPRLLICRCAPTVDSFILITTRYLILIDTLLNPATAEQLLAIARPYLRDGRTLLVINTHADWDHCWGNQLFAGPGALAPAPIVGSARCAARFGEEMDAQLREKQALEPARFAAVRPVAPTIHFPDRLTIDGGDLTLELFPTSGHTDDHVAIFIPQVGTLLAGDAAEDPFPFAYTVASLPLLRASLRTMRALTPRYAFYCHAPEGSGPGLIERNTAYFDRLEACCRAAIERGSDERATEDDGLERLVGLPFEESLADAALAASLPPMYYLGHRRHIRLMMEWLRIGEAVNTTG